MDTHPCTPEFLSSIPTIPSASAQEDMSKKVRKPYTITKSRESWTEQEHDKFLEALQLFDRDWKKIEAFIGSKSVIQIRSHAQKYFLKVQKNGTGEHVPPPRPKRKSAQPYPQKAVKSALAAHQIPISVSETNPAYTVVLQPCVATPVSSASLIPAWAHHMGAHESVHSVNKALPDFTEVYRFLGSVFDPTTNDHLDRMQEMAPINRETVLLLMRNLSINLSSADFDEHRHSPSVFDRATDNTWLGAGNNKKSLSDTPVVPCSRVLAAIS